MKNRSFQSKEDFKKRQILAVGPEVLGGPAPGPDAQKASQPEHDSSATNSSSGTEDVSPRKRGPAIWFAASLLALGVAAVAMGNKGKYTAHEWGTFTSVQGGDGVLLDWRPLESSRLPQFVYDWRKPGLDRRPTSSQYLSKVGLLTLQRMETPVIYFYSDREETVDVSVAFPQGLITEWYPQAVQIGPSATPIPSAIAKLDEFAHKAGAKPEFTFASFFGNKPIKESRAMWANVHLLPCKKNPALDGTLLQDRSGSHYFAARDTDADYLRLSSLNATNPTPEYEKFIFYRGAGSFATPLQVSMNSGNDLTIRNSGEESLVHLFVLQIRNGAGSFSYVQQIEPGQKRTLQVESIENGRNLNEVSAALGKQMAQALVREGLYQREATAMVNTWKDSWFAEDGVRVLYVLPRTWTDRTLPLTLDPAPREVVRVMVGRAEVLSPALEQKLAETLAKARGGDENSRIEAIAEFKKLGRFAEPALRLAIKGASEDSVRHAWNLFQTATTVPTGTTVPTATIVPSATPVTGAGGL